MYRIIKRFASVCLPALFMTACAPKIYQPPHMGAEYRFDEGLKPEKPKQRLFDEDMHKYLRETGVEQEPSSGGTSPVVHAPKDTTKPAKTASDTLNKDTLTTPVPASLTTSPDSSRNVPE